MPIQSLQRMAAFPEIGQIRKGGPKPQQGNKPGADLDHFRFTSTDPQAVQVFYQTFGQKPQTLGFFLPFPTLDENFEWWQEAYTAGAIQHRCDGQTCVGHRTSDGKWSTEPIPCPGGCKPSGRLKIFLPAFQRMVFVTVLTTSKYDILTIASTLQALQLVNGSLQNIPLLLRRVEVEVSTPNGNGGRARRKKWLLQIEAEPEWAARQFNSMRRLALSAASAPLQLTSGELDDDDDDEGNQPLGQTTSGVPTGAAPGAAPLMVDQATVKAITALWKEHGPKDRQGTKVPLQAYMRENLKANRWGEVPADQARQLLEWLQKRAVLAAEQAAEEATSNEPQVAPEETPSSVEVIEAEIAEVIEGGIGIEGGISPSRERLNQAMLTFLEAGGTTQEINTEFAQQFPQSTDLDDLTPEAAEEFATFLVTWAEAKREVQS